MRPPITQTPGVFGTDVDRAQIFGVIRHGGEVERSLDSGFDPLLAVLVGERNRESLGIAIRIRRIVSLARDIRVERIACVYVKIAKEGLPSGDTSVITLKAAIDDHLKTGHLKSSGTSG